MISGGIQHYLQYYLQMTLADEDDAGWHRYCLKYISTYINLEPVERALAARPGCQLLKSGRSTADIMLFHI
jgi:hypothetical protein